MINMTYFGQVILRDPLDDNVAPIVKELQRRLPPVNAISQGQGEDETGDENGIHFEMILPSRTVFGDLFPFLLLIKVQKTEVKKYNVQSCLKVLLE